jgi:CHAD domain-containing protein
MPDKRGRTTSEAYSKNYGKQYHGMIAEFKKLDSKLSTADAVKKALIRKGQGKLAKDSSSVSRIIKVYKDSLSRIEPKTKSVATTHKRR